MPWLRAGRETGWLLFFAASTAFLIGTTELMHDEAYYWTWSQRLDWGYFDHPPGVAWLIALSARWLPGEWGVRLAPCLALFAGALFALRTLVPPERRWAWWAGWAASPLLSLMPAMAVPDTALLASAPLFFWAFARYLDEDGPGRAIAVAATAALMLYAKYLGAFLVLGAVLAVPQVWRRRSLWVAAGAGLLLLLPHIHWQWEHEGATVAYHLFEAHGVADHRWLEPVQYAALQVVLPGLLLGPWIWWQGWRGRRASPFDRALAGMVVANIGGFLLVSFFKKIEANWTLAGTLALLLLALRTVPELPRRRLWFRALGGVSVAAMLAVKVAIAIPASARWAPRLGEVHGWRSWAEALDRATPDCVLVANRLQVASKLSFYLGREVPSINVRSRPNQWDFWDPDDALRGKPLCWIAKRTELQGERWPVPSSESLWLVRQVTIEQLRAMDSPAPGE